MVTNKTMVYALVVISLVVLVSGLKVPKFTELKRNYPGYKLYGGSKTDEQINKLLTVERIEHHTSAIRLSYSLNHIDYQHAIYTNKHVLNNDSIICDEERRDECYIQNPVMFGPYLEKVYKTPEFYRATKRNRREIISELRGRRGIVRLATFQYEKADARVALWDCDQFYQTRNWILKYRHLIAVEFWESPGTERNDPAGCNSRQQRPVRIRHHHKALRGVERT
ncbi:uncharacterized protein LOC141899719 [Tubulanus polymorphus]|uniref:uncharacterized protein LOC141899719 n=1 Tax=Tubulanus polymorphus TaxID=672921 RepID=UPI003DA4C082